MHMHVKPSFFSKLFILLEGIVFFFFSPLPVLLLLSFLLCGTIVSEEGWLSEDAYCMYIRTVPDAYVRMHIPEPDNFLRMYLRT